MSFLNQLIFKNHLIFKVSCGCWSKYTIQNIQWPKYTITKIYNAKIYNAKIYNDQNIQWPKYTMTKIYNNQNIQWPKYTILYFMQILVHKGKFAEVLSLLYPMASRKVRLIAGQKSLVALDQKRDFLLNYSQNVIIFHK